MAFYVVLGLGFPKLYIILTIIKNLPRVEEVASHGCLIPIVWSLRGQVLSRCLHMIDCGHCSVRVVSLGQIPQVSADA